MMDLKQILKESNVAEILDDATLGNMGKSVLDGYELDVNDTPRQEKSEKWEKGQKIVKQVMEEKNVPFNDASNVKYPLLTTACIQFNARSYPAIVSGNSIVKPQMVGSLSIPDDLTEEKLAEMPQKQQQELMQLAQTITQKQGKADRACEYMNWQLFNELEEWEEDTDRLLLMLPLYGDMFRKTWYSASKNRLESKILSPEHLIVPSNTPTLEDAPRITEIFTLYPNQIVERVRDGTFIDFNFQDDKDAEHEFLEQHMWYDLDEDGYKEPYICIVHKPTGNCVQVIPAFMMGDVVGDKEITKINRINLYTRYSFIPSSDGSFYSLGFFDILYPINAVIDSSINQLMDAGRLANSSSGFIGKEARLRKGSYKFGVGEWKTVPVKGEDIRKGMFQLDFPGPNQTLFQLLGFMVEAGREVANIKDVLTGDQNVNIPATTTLALIEQGTKVYSAIHKRVYRALRKELRILKEWDVRVLDDEKYSEVLDAPVQKDDFEDSGYDFVPVADPEVATDAQRMGRAEVLLGFRGDPYVNQMEIRKRALEAANLDMENLLQQPEQSLEALQQENEQLKQQLQQVGQGRLQLQAKEQARKEKETDSKAKKVDSDIQLNKVKMIEGIANAESKEMGDNISAYRAEIEKDKASIGEESDRRRDILTMAKLAGDKRNAGNSR